MTTYRTYSKTDIVEGETTLSGAQKTNTRFSDIISWFPSTASAAQYMVMSLASGLAGFTFTHIFRSNVAINHDQGNGSANQALISDGDGTTNWSHVVRSNVALNHDAGNGTSGQFLQSDGDGTTSWATAIPLTDGDKGDITVTSSGTVWTIDNNTITNAKIASNAATQDKTSFTFATKITTYTAVANDYLYCDTSGAAWTLTFPVSATAGDKIFICDLNNTFDLKNLTINPNGLKIEGQTGNLVLDLRGFTGLYRYIDTTTGWKKI